MSHDSKADIDRFDAMESDELFENTLRIVKYIESALKRRDDVSRKIVNEMTSDLVKDDCQYLKDRIRILDKRALYIYTTGEVPGAVAPRQSARDYMLRWMKNDFQRVGSAVNSTSVYVARADANCERPKCEAP